MDDKEADVRELLQEASEEVRIIVAKVIDLEYTKLHMNKPHGIKEEIGQLIRGVVK